MSDDLSDDEEPPAIGWDAIDAALSPIYGDQEPMHWGVALPHALGGNDPIHGISAYRSSNQSNHLHFVTYGFSELWEKESDDPEWSGFGMELTFRLKAKPEDDPEAWTLNFLQNLGRYVFQTGRVFGAGHTMPLNGPIHIESDTKIHAIMFVEDPELGAIDTPNGRVEFVQIVGLTVDELNAIDQWNSRSFADLIREHNPLFITDVNRDSLLDDPEFNKAVQSGIQRDGSQTGQMYGDQFSFKLDKSTNEYEFRIGALISAPLSRRLVARIPFDRDFTVSGEGGSILFSPADTFDISIEDEHCQIQLPLEHCTAFAELLSPKSGTYHSEIFPNLTVIVEPTEIKDEDGNVTDTLG